MAFAADRIFVPFLIAILAYVAPAWAAPRRPLDRVRIHGLYHDGEFEKVLRELEPYGKGQCACVRDDSVFAEKHLAVVLAANPATRELGRYHMFRLLDLSPRADLLDMFVGDEVDAIFDKARKEHDLRSKETAARSGRPAPVGAASLRFQARAVGNGALPRRGSASAKPYAPWDALPAARPAAVGAENRAIEKVADARVAISDSAPLPDRAQAARVDAAFGTEARSEAAPAGSESAAGEAPAQDLSGSAEAKAPASGIPARALPEADSARPVWKQPGLWIGGGAAVAAIAFTFWHAGSEGGSPGKTYAVPASLSK